MATVQVLQLGTVAAAPGVSSIVTNVALMKIRSAPLVSGGACGTSLRPSPVAVPTFWDATTLDHRPLRFATCFRIVWGVECWGRGQVMYTYVAETARIKKTTGYTCSFGETSLDLVV